MAKIDPPIIRWRERLLATNNARTARGRIFQHTQVPNIWSEIETDLPGVGTVRVAGKVGQRHELLMEAINFHAIKTRRLENGVLAVLVDMHDLRKTLTGKGKERYGVAGVLKLAKALRQVTVSGQDVPFVDGILNQLIPTSATIPHPIPGRPPRPLWRAEFTACWAAWLDADPVHLHYDPRLLAGIRSGVAAAVTRLILTHRDQPQGGWILDRLIRTVGVEPTRWVRQDVRVDSEAMAAAGVRVIGDRVFLLKHGGVASLPATVASLPGAVGTL